MTPPSPRETELLRAAPVAMNGYFPALGLVGGAQAGAVIEKLLASKDATVRAAAAETCRHAIFGASTTAALTRAAGDPSPQVRRAAIAALGQYANWRYPEAQSALIRLATQTEAGLADRLQAADGLAYAVRMQVKGVRQDPPMIAALISLLKDKEEPVSAVAMAALAPAFEPPAPGSARRRGPEQGWEQWLADVTAKATFPAAAATDLSGAFQAALRSAEAGDVRAQSSVAMMYANGKGVQQDYAAAGKWWMKAAGGGDLAAARHAWNLYRNGEGVERNPALANVMAPLIGEPVQAPRPSPRPASAAQGK